MTQAGELYWSLIEPYWEIYDIGDWQRIAGVHSALPMHIAALLATHWTHEALCNGGYEQYFFNSAGVIAPEAVAGFRALGLDALASITAEAAKLLGAPYPRDSNERIARRNELGRQLHLEGHGTGPLDNLTERFFEALQSSGGDDVFVQAADRYARRFAH